MNRVLSQWIAVALVSPALALATGCEDESGESDRGKVDVKVRTPGGDYGVEVDYPKDAEDEDKDKDDVTRVRVHGD